MVFFGLGLAVSLRKEGILQQALEKPFPLSLKHCFVMGFCTPFVFSGFRSQAAKPDEASLFPFHFQILYPVLCCTARATE